MIDPIVTKLISSLTDPAALVLLLFVCYLIWEKHNDRKVISKLLTAQEERGKTLSSITVMIDQLLRFGGRAS